MWPVRYRLAEAGGREQNDNQSTARREPSVATILVDPRESNLVSSQPFLPFSRPTISEEAISEVVQCLRSGWITTGPRVKRFEQLLSEYFDTPDVQSCA